ncbi:class I SAM-dependent methyltransferase [Bradyrhizobium sp. CCGUVB1N3]|uniref:class I SAM-dependent methyltransferase n=1 Tax=Bradyrhizobium sp. CCGUVB1N3 TaxID=2949629 RepID=UPI0020B30FBD|nr:methyltransferase domain-containing protein [Bradyrhizobium sp. CCGUVB1N3]MCP3476606.1 class I SAM-dependent methyltransferase [Bradyrhizobium sp. CCGUVB1N3]
MKRLLNAGSGSGTAQRIAPMMLEHGWEETRFDIDPNVEPDVIGSILELSGAFKPQSFNAVWTSHVLEHLYAHEVYPALRQFHQVLKLDGFALIMSPDLQSVAQFIVDHGIDAIAYHSPAGPISPLDMLYGHSRAIEKGRVHMAHRTGFTAERLGNLLLMAGFPTVSIISRNFEICALALMPETDGEAVQRSLLESGFNFQEAQA